MMSEQTTQTTQKNEDTYSLKVMLISNFCSFFTGLVVHYFTGGHH
jgi:hypothetical protein